jgi:hypothetical protein
MKKILGLSITALLLSCSSSPTYTKMVELSYNFNRNAANLIMESDTLKGDFTQVRDGKKLFVNDSNGQFFLKLSNNPNSIELIDNEGKGSKLEENRGFKITNKMVGDTLVIQYFPTESTPSSILKFGTEYKIYN